VLRVHEVAIATTVTLPFTILAAFGLAEISDRGEFCTDDPLRIIATIETFHGSACLFLVLELDIHVAYHMVANIICDDYFFDLAEAGQLHENFLIEVFKVIDGLDKCLLLDLVPVSEGNGGGRVLVHVREDHSLTKGRFIVQAGACVSMAASADLEIEGTINLVFFGSEYLG